MNSLLFGFIFRYLAAQCDVAYQITSRVYDVSHGLTSHAEYSHVQHTSDAPICRTRVSTVCYSLHVRSVFGFYDFLNSG